MNSAVHMTEAVALLASFAALLVVFWPPPPPPPPVHHSAPAAYPRHPIFGEYGGGPVPAH